MAPQRADDVFFVAPAGPGQLIFVDLKKTDKPVGAKRRPEMSTDRKLINNLAIRRNLGGAALLHFHSHLPLPLFLHSFVCVCECDFFFPSRLALILCS